MPKFNEFYQRVFELRDKYPNLTIAAFSDNNLSVLKRLTAMCDHADYFLSEEEYQTVRSAIQSGKMPAGQMSVDDASRMCEAVKMALNKQARHEFVGSLNNDLFSALKDVNKLKAVSLQDEEIIARRILELESRWDQQKHYADLPLNAFMTMKFRFDGIKRYLALMASDLNAQTPSVKEDMQTVIIELLSKLGKEYQWLAEAAVARLELVPTTDLFLLFGSIRETHDFTPCSGDFCLNMADMLIEVGLSSDYVETLKRLDRGQSMFSRDSVVELRDLVGMVGEEKIKMRLKSLIDGESGVLLPSIRSEGQRLFVPDDAQDLNEGEKMLTAWINWLQDVGDPLSPEIQDELSVVCKMADLDGLMQLINRNESAGAFTSAAAVRKSVTARDERPAEKEVQSAQSPRSEIPALKNLAKVLSHVSDYMLENPVHSSSHSRQGRAQHISGLIWNVFNNFKNTSNIAQLHEQNRALIFILFLHYQSIDNSKSELSVLIEKSLVELLGFNSERFPKAALQDFENARQKSMERRDSSAKLHYSHAKTLLFGSAMASDKTLDPLFLFIKKHIIQNEPTLREMLFEKNPEKKELVLNKECEQMLSQLVDKDRLETAIFKNIQVDSGTFDAIFETPSQPGETSAPKPE